MKYKLILFLTLLEFSTINAKVDLPEISKKHGPLYQGIRLLINNETLNAELSWNDTQHQIDENSHILQKALDYMHNYEEIINEKLDQLNNLEHSDEVKRCYKKYERQIARFNRELLNNYYVCKQALNSSLEQLKDEVMEEINYIRDAAIEIQELAYVCNISDLKRIGREIHHASVTICVLSNLGEIQQHILESSQICLNILARMAINQEDNDEILEDGKNGIGGSNNVKSTKMCLNFEYLRDEFERIYDNVMLCVEEIK